MGDLTLPFPEREGLPGHTLGDAVILKRPLLALVCSVRCPGDLILKAYDTAKALGMVELYVHT